MFILYKEILYGSLLSHFLIYIHLYTVYALKIIYIKVFSEVYT